MIYKMKLVAEPFESIKSGSKKIEIRLNDEKRQKLVVNDMIEFSKLPDLKEKLMVEVKELLLFKTFAELYDELSDRVDSNYLKRWDKDNFVMSCRSFYTEGMEEEHGALGIRIKVLQG